MTTWAISPTTFTRGAWSSSNSRGFASGHCRSAVRRRPLPAAPGEVAGLPGGLRVVELPAHLSDEVAGLLVERAARGASSSWALLLGERSSWTVGVSGSVGPARWPADLRAGRQLRVQALTWQYQNAADDDSWVFRADYSRSRSAAASRPRGHLHIDGTLRHPEVLRPKQPLGRVHFPCHRPTLEAAVVLLADGFGVPTNAPHEVWRAAVAEHEAKWARLFDS